MKLSKPKYHILENMKPASQLLDPSSVCLPGQKDRRETTTKETTLLELVD